MAKKKKRRSGPKGGRPKHEPTDQLRTQAAVGAALGVPHHELAAAMRIDTKTLLKYYALELRTAKTMATMKIGGKLLTAAYAGEPWAINRYLACQAGWTENRKIELTGKDGKPLQPPTFSITFPDGGPGHGGTDPDVEVSGDGTEGGDTEH